MRHQPEMYTPSQVRPSRSNITCLVVLLLTFNHAASGLALIDDRPVEPEDIYRLDCVVTPETKVDKLDDDCVILKVFNQTQVDEMDAKGQLLEVAKHCACQLASMHEIWEESFIDTQDAMRLSNMNLARIQQSLQSNETSLNSSLESRHPKYLWSDLEVIVYKISIHTATRDYFEQQANSNESTSLAVLLRKKFQKDELWATITRFCRKVSRDPFKLYRYLENLQRTSPSVFFRLVALTEAIEIIYQASKACKMLVYHKLQDFRLKPENPDLVVVDMPNKITSNEIIKVTASDTENPNNIDSELRDASALLLKCDSIETEQMSFISLARQCPIMIGDELPSKWLEEQQSSADRSDLAIKCGCQLLLHKPLWAKMVNNPNVVVMAKALTNYMNQNGVPDFYNTPIWSIHGWFDNIMSKFMTNRKLSVKEIVKTRIGSQDPTQQINKLTPDVDKALELLRRGCNYIMFNYHKGSKRQPNELKLIKYLDNLQLMSQDPMFVFHLSLQDPNLFKLHALSKMCKPIVM